MYCNNNEDQMQSYLSFLQDGPYFELENYERNNKTEKAEDERNGFNQNDNIPKTEYLKKKTNREEKKQKKKTTEKEQKEKETAEDSQGNNYDSLNMEEDEDKINFDNDYFNISNIEVNQSQNSYKRSDNIREEFPNNHYKVMSLTEVTKDKSKKNG